MKHLFITGSGTGIGKTYVTQALLAWDQAHSQKLSASKPIISDWPGDDQDIQHTDTGILMQAQQIPCTQEAIARLSPWRYRLPLTPQMAAKGEGKKVVQPNQLADYSQQLFAEATRAQQIHLIEGVGGLMSPIADQFTNLEWIQKIGCACVLVMGSYLGALSHAFTAFTVLRLKGVHVAAVMVNETPDSTVALSETSASVKAFVAPTPVFILPYQETTALKNAIQPLYAYLLER